MSRSASGDAIAFIGGGNMARSLVGGMVARGADPASIRVAEPVEALREALARDFGIRAYAGAAEAVEGAGTWVFAVKPQVMREVCESLAGRAREARPLALSIAAGITAGQLSAWLGGDAAVVRAMPNTPALLGAGVTGLHANAAVDADGRERAQALLSAVPEPDPVAQRNRRRIVLSGELPDPANPPVGCNFQSRCTNVIDRCRQVDPELRHRPDDRRVACIRVGE